MKYRLIAITLLLIGTSMRPSEPAIDRLMQAFQQRKTAPIQSMIDPQVRLYEEDSPRATGVTAVMAFLMKTVSANTLHGYTMIHNVHSAQACLVVVEWVGRGVSIRTSLYWHQTELGWRLREIRLG
ncbi:MAG: hypothetical protein ACKO5C_02280 [Ferruginibacter sp.]